MWRPERNSIALAQVSRPPTTMPDKTPRRLAPLRSRTNTRYGWVACPYPTGTFTRQKTPSFARRDNDNDRKPSPNICTAALNPDRPREGLVQDTAPLQPATVVLRQARASGKPGAIHIASTVTKIWQSMPPCGKS